MWNSFLAVCCSDLFIIYTYNLITRSLIFISNLLQSPITWHIKHLRIFCLIITHNFTGNLSIQSLWTNSLWNTLYNIQDRFCDSQWYDGTVRSRFWYPHISYITIISTLSYIEEQISFCFFCLHLRHVVWKSFIKNCCQPLAFHYLEYYIMKREHMNSVTTTINGQLCRWVCKTTNTNPKYLKKCRSH